ncbi:hypothetical protein HK097_005582, partial [Rhizophlyctis rosea]
MLKEYLLRRDYAMFRRVKRYFDELWKGRRRLVAGVERKGLEEEGLVRGEAGEVDMNMVMDGVALSDLRRKMISVMEVGNFIQGLDVVVRHSGTGMILSERNIGTIPLYRRHLDLQSKNQERSTSPDSLSPPLKPLRPTGTGITPLSLTPARDLSELAMRFSQVWVDVLGWGGGSISSVSYGGIGIAQDEVAEVYFGIYNKAEGRWVSEEFLVVVDWKGNVLATGEGDGADKKTKTLFMDLSHRDLDRSEALWIVGRVVRVGKMVSADSGGGTGGRPALVRGDTGSSFGSLKSSASGSDGDRGKVRRPFGWGVASLAEVLKERAAEDDGSGVSVTKSFDLSMPIFTPTTESNFGTLHDNILHKLGGFESAGTLINLRVKVFHGDAADVMNSKVHAPLLKSIVLTPRNGFGDVIIPNTVRNSMYITLSSGDFSHSGLTFSPLQSLRLTKKSASKTSARNIEVSVQIRLSSGEFVKNCISKANGCGRDASWRSVVSYHSNQPKWGEMIRVDLSPGQFERSHVFLLVRHVSSGGSSNSKEVTSPGGSGDGSEGVGEREGTFAFGFLPLLRGNHTVLHDALHTLHLYRFDRKAAHPSVYLNFAPGPDLAVPARLAPKDVEGAVEALKFNQNGQTGDSVGVRTRLCSTKLTQGRGLLGLVHWKEGVKKGTLSDSDGVGGVLERFMETSETEIIKFLPQIFDGLFSILESELNNQGRWDEK